MVADLKSVMSSVESYLGGNEAGRQLSDVLSRLPEDSQRRFLERVTGAGRRSDPMAAPETGMSGIPEGQVGRVDGRYVVLPEGGSPMAPAENLPGGQEAPASLTDRLRGVMDQYSPEARARLLEKLYTQTGGGGLGGALATIAQTVGETVAGRDPNVLASQQRQDEARARGDVLGLFERERKQALEGIGMEADLGQLQRREDLRDPNSAVSKEIREVARGAGIEVSDQVSGEILLKTFPTLATIGKRRRGAEARAREIDTLQRVLISQFPEQEKLIRGIDSVKGLQELGDNLRAERKETAPTQSQSLASTYGQRMVQSDTILTELEDYATTRESGFFGLPFVPNPVKPEEQQRLEQAKRNFINAVLRRESGAAIAPSEFESADKQYFPQWGDSPAVVEQKRKNRETAIQGMLREGRVALPEGAATGVQRAPKPSSPSSPTTPEVVSIRMPDGTVKKFDKSTGQEVK